MGVLVHGKHLQLLSLWGQLFLHITALLSIITLLFVSVALWEVVANTLWSSPAFVSRVYPSTLVLLQEPVWVWESLSIWFSAPTAMEKKMAQPTPVFSPGNSHGQRSQWVTVQGVAEESGTTEWLNNNNPQQKSQSLYMEDAGSLVPVFRLWFQIITLLGRGCTLGVPKNPCRKHLYHLARCVEQSPSCCL